MTLRTLGLRWTGKITATSGRAAMRRMAAAMLSSPPPKFSRRWLVTPMIRLPAKRCSSSASPPASAGSAAMRRVTQCSASITVLPVTWTRAGSTFSRRSAAAEVSVGAKCRLAIAPMILRFTSSGQGW